MHHRVEGCELLPRLVKAAFLVLVTISASSSFALGVEAAPNPSALWNVYIHAHQDDWQLFESPSSFDEYQAGESLLIIYTTAGDAGASSSWWRPREEGAKASVRWIAGSQTESSASVSICYGQTPAVCHSIWRWTYGRITSFFMRLPDGNPSGGGYASSGFVSLGKLRDGVITSISAVDGSTTYSSWKDFYTTLRAFVVTYAPYDSTTSIHAPDFDRNAQTSQASMWPNWPDHSDHLATADAVYAMAAGTAAPWSLSAFIDYPLGFADPRYPANLDPNRYTVKKSLFMAYSDAVKALTGVDEYRSNAAFWENCFQRSYFRSVYWSAISIDFSFSPTQPAVGKSVSFSGTATGGTSPYSFAWKFGDQSTGSGATVSHAYALAGTFTVTLTVSDSASHTGAVTKSVVVTPPLAADFSFSPTKPVVGETISFSATASGGMSPYSYSWTFGDGSSGSGAKVGHGYSAKGTFTVTLTVSDSGTHTARATRSVAVTPALVVSFTLTPTLPVAGETVSFTGSATGGTTPYSYGWNFGDGSTGAGATVSHAFASAGSYRVTFIASDSAGHSLGVTKSVDVTPKPTADISFAPTKPMTLEGISFLAVASGGTTPYVFAWDFGDGSSGSGVTVSYAYSTAGTFTVTLDVSDSAGHRITVTKSIVVTPPLVADYAFMPTNPVTGEWVILTAIPAGGTSPYSYTWDMGDGSTYDGGSIEHAYASAGTFTVTLTVRDSAEHVLTMAKSIPVTPPVTADFTLSQERPMAGETISFSGMADGGTPAYAFAWAFGDGSTDYGMNTTYAYPAAGSFRITLEASDSAGHVASESRTIEVSPLLTVDFAFTPSNSVILEVVSFSATALGGTSPYTYSWAFGEGGTDAAALANHSYAQAGSFPATLRVSDAAGHATVVAKTVSVTPPVAAIFTFSPARPSAGELVSFSPVPSGGTPPYTYSWDFGDGTSSVEAQPKHGYGGSGFSTTYTARVRTCDSAGHCASSSEDIPVQNWLLTFEIVEVTLIVSVTGAWFIRRFRVRKI